ncbi:MAG: tetratricopeptide repeat protein [Desulfobacterales bacterium]|nr:tetratricopeptide repeat protein [Desulfobacterales bacterium]
MDTITTGGDTGSHFYTAKYLNDYLIPNFKISGWCMGNIAGFPMLQYYFPFPFIIISILSLIFPLTIAFKIVSILGIFLLPVSTYFFFKALNQKFPVPIIGAVFSLPFLFMEGNTMWGGNIPSTLSGEFCFSISFALAVFWLGSIYETIAKNKGIIKCAVILALVGICHGYSVLYVGFASSFFLFTTESFNRNLKILFKIHFTAFLLLSFWLIPLLAFLPYTTRFNILWFFFSIKHFFSEALPKVVYPYVLGTIIVLLLIPLIKRKSIYKPFFYIIFLSMMGIILYGLGYKIGLVDIRFLPFFQFFIIIGSAFVLSLFILPYSIKLLSSLLFVFLTFLWIDSHSTFIEGWIKTNYNGFENTKLWESYSAVNKFLQGTINDARIVYEHSDKNSKAGTIRAFEAIPLFSGRPTLEGVYIQASLSVPFIFYIQSEISQTSSMPLPEKIYSRVNIHRAIEHLKLLNVSHFIAIEEKTKEALSKMSEFKLACSYPPYDVFELRTNSNSYAEVLKYKPLLVSKDKWNDLSYKWFRLSDMSVILVFDDNPEKYDINSFNINEFYDMENLPKEIIDESIYIKDLKVFIKNEEILIQEAPIGKPLLIKVSYHPNWKVKGAKKIYLASPSFMLIFPDSKDVKLYYGKTWPDYVGKALTLITILIIALFSFYNPMTEVISPFFIILDRYGTKILVIFIISFIIFLTVFLFKFAPESPLISYNKGVNEFSKNNYNLAEKYFKYVINRHKYSQIADQAQYHLAMCFFRQNDWNKALLYLNDLFKIYPETRRYAEALYHIGFCYLKIDDKDKAKDIFTKIINECENEVWAKYADERLKEMSNE